MSARALLPALCLALTSAARAEPAAADPTAPDPAALAAWNAERIAITRGGMWVLGGWGAASLVGGGLGAALADDERWRGFHLMTAGWGLVDAGLAAISLYNNRPEDAGDFDAAASLEAQLGIERALLFNAGLDVGYLTLGAWLWERGLRKGDRMLEGAGQAIIVQGGFLLAFDVTLYLLEASHGETLRWMLLPGGAALSGRF